MTIVASGVLAIDIPIVPDLVEGALEEATTAALDAVAEFVFGLIVGAVEAVTDALVVAMDEGSRVGLAGDFGGLAELRSTVLAMSAALMLAFFFLNVIKALTSGEPGPVIRAALIDLPAAAALTTLFVAVANVVLVIVDLASAEMLGDVGTALGKIAAALVAGNTVSAQRPEAAGLLGVVFGLLYVFAALLVWAELLIRSALIYVIVVLAPLGYASRASAGSRQIARRTTEILFAVIVSKLGIAIAFGVGAAIIDDGVGLGDEGGGEVDLGAMFVGSTVILLAAFMPWMLLKAIPILEAATVSQGAERAPLRTVGTVTGIALAATSAARMAGRSSSTPQAKKQGSAQGGGDGPDTPSSGGGGSRGPGGSPSNPESAGTRSATAERSADNARPVSESRTSTTTTGASDVLTANERQRSAVPSDVVAAVNPGVQIVDVGAPRPGVVAVTESTPPPPSERSGSAEPLRRRRTEPESTEGDQ